MELPSHGSQVRSAHHANAFLHPTLVRPDGSLANVAELRGDAAAADPLPHAAAVAGVMIGRAAYEQPWACLSSADTQVNVSAAHTLAWKPSSAPGVASMLGLCSYRRVDTA